MDLNDLMPAMPYTDEEQHAPAGPAAHAVAAHGAVHRGALPPPGHVTCVSRDLKVIIGIRLVMHMVLSTMAGRAAPAWPCYLC